MVGKWEERVESAFSVPFDIMFIPMASPVTVTNRR